MVSASLGRVGTSADLLHVISTRDQEVRAPVAFLRAALLQLESNSHDLPAPLHLRHRTTISSQAEAA